MGPGAVVGFGLLAAIALVLAAEMMLRLKGFQRFPLFAHHAAGGFRMRANQAGRFLNRVEWSYDAHSMRAPGGVMGPAGAVLIVGDSVVEGGLRIAQNQTLAAQVSLGAGLPTYPFACHGWSLANVLPALQTLPGWREAQRLVFVLNPGDFDYVTVAASELSFPTRRPHWLLAWLVRRHAFRRGWFRRGPSRAFPRDPVLRVHNLALFRTLCAEFSGPIFVVAYPRLGEEALDDGYFAELASAAGGELVDVKASALWSDACYADDLHPNAHGVRALATIICERCC